MRFRADSNRCTRFCRPLPSHSATKPCFFDGAKVSNSHFTNKYFFKPVSKTSEGMPGKGSHAMFDLSFPWFRVPHRIQNTSIWPMYCIQIRCRNAGVFSVQKVFLYLSMRYFFQNYHEFPVPFTRFHPHTSNN